MIIPVLISGVTFISCDADKAELKVGVGLDYTYAGTYTAIRSSDGLTVTSLTPTIELSKDGKYSYKGMPHSQGYGSGKYSIKEDKITFELITWNTNFIDDNGMIVALDMDPNILLKGEYDYVFVGNNLNLSKTFTLFYNDSEYIYCEYKLKIQIR